MIDFKQQNERLSDSNGKAKIDRTQSRSQSDLSAHDAPAYPIANPTGCTSASLSVHRSEAKVDGRAANSD